MAGRLAGKSIILTGCSAGIGKQVAIKYAEEGADLVIDARRADRLEETRRLCEEKGARVVAIAGDLLDYHHLEELVNAAITNFGKLDVLVNNAARGTQGQSIMDTSDELLEGIMNTNFRATWNLMKLCYPHLKANGGGAIVNVCSSAGTLGFPSYSPYAASKEAIRGLSRCAAHEWGPDNIRVNVVCPGCMTDTIREVGFAPVMEKMSEMTPLKRCGDAYKDITPSYVFLASDEAQFITGQTLAVDGGTAILP